MDRVHTVRGLGYGEDVPGPSTSAASDGAAEIRTEHQARNQAGVGNEGREWLGMSDGGTHRGDQWRATGKSEGRSER